MFGYDQQIESKYIYLAAGACILGIIALVFVFPVAQSYINGFIAGTGAIA